MLRKIQQCTLMTTRLTDDFEPRLRYMDMACGTGTGAATFALNSGYIIVDGDLH